MTIKRKHRCDDMCGKLQATCLFEQGVSHTFVSVCYPLVLFHTNILYLSSFILSNNKL